MTARTWLALCVCLMIMSGISGWLARITTADHRYVRALAERHEAETNYIYRKTDELIQENKANIAKERKTNGTKTN